MRRVWLGLAVAALWLPGRGAAQQRRVEQLYTADGIRLDYPPNGVWRARARQIMANRARLMAAGEFSTLNSALAAGPAGAAGAASPASATSLTGVIRVPTILVSFNNTDTTVLPKAVIYDSVYNTSVPLTGRPYTVRTYYEEISNGLFSVQGTVYGWVKTDSSSTLFYSACGSSGASALNCTPGRQRLWSLIAGSLAKLDAAVDFSQYDANDDGVVDDIRIVQPVVGAECGGPGYNAHHFSLVGLLQSLGAVYTTNDLWPGHGGAHITVNSYHVVPGVGGPSCTSTGEVTAMGTAAHELGHGLGLPDLYDVSFATEGIGEFGIMGSGNYTSLISPSHYEAWSKQQLGWVTVTPLTANGTYTPDPVETSHEVFLVRVQGSNPRGEYFLLENREALGSDTANMLGARPKHGGLLLWHIDSTQVVNHTIFIDDAPNAGPIHGVELTQADGRGQLDGQSPTNRGDSGDPYPGDSGRTAFSFNTVPAAVKNSDGSFVGFVVDSIRQVVPNGQMAFRLRFAGLTTVQASDPAVTIKVDAAPFGLFRQVLDSGSSHTIAIDTPQVSPSGRTRYGFVSWSDGGAISHTITGGLSSVTYTASVSRAHRLDYAAGANGSITSGTPTATFVPEGNGILLTAVADSGYALNGWSGDTTAVSAALTLPMGRPMSVSASFAGILSVTSAASRPSGTMGYPYSDTLHVTGGNGSTSWALISGSLGGLTLLANGVITGFPHLTGLVSFTVRATSGAQTADKSFSFSVAAPTIDPAGVVSTLLNTGTPLSADDQRYLDFLGNNNGLYDLGDFLNWVKLTGATPPPVAPKPNPTAPRGGRP
jgi:M6 family metalloprotease-like protein